MKDDEKDNQSPCCGDSDCCKPTAADGGKRGNRWGTLIFTAVLLMAGAVAAYSLFLRKSDAVGSGCCPGGSSGAAACVTTPTINGFDQRLTWTDFSFVIFLRPGDELPQGVSDVLAAASNEIGAKEIRPQTRTLLPDDPAFATAVDQYQITIFPAVLVLGTAGSAVLTMEDVSKDSIMNLYTLDATAVQAGRASGQSN